MTTHNTTDVYKIIYIKSHMLVVIRNGTETAFDVKKSTNSNVTTKDTWTYMNLEDILSKGS